MDTYNSIDQRLHQLAQTIAKFNRCFADFASDDSHTNLTFDPIGHRLLGRWVEVEEACFILSLELERFEFQIFDRNWSKQWAIGVEGKSQTEVEAAIKPLILELGLNPKGFIHPLHYEIPVYHFSDQAFTPLDEAAARQWATYRSLAQDASFHLLNHLQMEAEIRIWPHHFDTGIYLEPNPKVGIGFGLAMEDELVHSPYFYCRAYPLDGSHLDYSGFGQLPIGEWLVQDQWQGAVLRLEAASTQSLYRFIQAVLPNFFPS